MNIFEVKKTTVPGVVELGQFSTKYRKNPDSYKPQIEALIKFMDWKIWGIRYGGGWNDVNFNFMTTRMYDWHHDGFGDQPDKHTIILMQVSDPLDKATEFTSCVREKGYPTFCDCGSHSPHSHSHSTFITAKPFTLYAIDNHTVAHRSPSSSGQRTLLRCFVLGPEIC